MLLSREAYSAFCRQAPPDFPLFQFDWYLNAVCGPENWQAIGVEKASRLVAVWPLYLKRRLGITYAAMPLLVRQMGPYLLPEWRDPRRETGIMEELLKALPPLAGLNQDFPYTVTNWLPFYWEGFRQTTRYTYQLPLHDLQALWQNLAPDYRNQKIPKARKKVRVYTGDDLEAFMRIHNQSFVRQGLTPPVGSDVLTRVDEVLKSRDARAILFAASIETGEIYSVAYLVWDRERVYALLGGDNPAHRNTGSSVLLTWSCIEFAATHLQLPWYDFAGSMIKPIERVRRQFGAVQQPYFRLEKEWSYLWKLYRWWGRR